MLQESISDVWCSKSPAGGAQVSLYSLAREPLERLPETTPCLPLY